MSNGLIECPGCGHELWNLMASDGFMGTYCPVCRGNELAAAKEALASAQSALSVKERQRVEQRARAARAESQVIEMGKLLDPAVIAAAKSLEPMQALVDRAEKAEAAEATMRRILGDIEIASCPSAEHEQVVVFCPSCQEAPLPFRRIQHQKDCVLHAILKSNSPGSALLERMRELERLVHDGFIFVEQDGDMTGRMRSWAKAARRVLAEKERS